MVSARGTAAAAALTRDDTVYCVTPPSHPSGLLVAIGGAIAGGARFALARGYEPETFWEEIRRYGGTVAVYTWTMLRALVEAAPTALEDGSPLRLFVGSGMPPALWRQVLDRFPSVRVVEFYTVSDSEAVLVNLGGSKVGSQGRKLPGAARVRLVHFDTATGQLELDGRGFAKPCRTGETGVLLAEVDPSDAARGIVAAARGVFAPDDAWVVTGDLFVRDEDGDLWLLDAAAGLIHTEDGVRAPNAIRDALETLPAVQEAVVYGFRPDPAVAPLAVAAVRRRRRHKLKAEDLDALFQARDDEARPDVVRLVDEIERTPWYRPVAGALPAQGLPTSSARRPAWCYDAEARRFRALSPERRKRLTPP